MFCIEANQDHELNLPVGDDFCCKVVSGIFNKLN